MVLLFKAGCWVYAHLGYSILNINLKRLCIRKLESVLSYGILYWGFISDPIRIFRIEKKAIGSIPGAKQNAHCINLFIKLGITPAIGIYLYFFCGFM